VDAKVNLASGCSRGSKRDDTFFLKLLRIDERKPMPEEGSKEGGVSFQVRGVQEEAKSNKRSLPLPFFCSFTIV
jgi:hypothetical protein